MPDIQLPAFLRESAEHHHHENQQHDSPMHDDRHAREATPAHGCFDSHETCVGSPRARPRRDAAATSRGMHAENTCMDYDDQATCGGQAAGPRNQGAHDTWAAEGDGARRGRPARLEQGRDVRCGAKQSSSLNAEDHGAGTRRRSRSFNVDGDRATGRLAQAAQARSDEYGEQRGDEARGDAATRLRVCGEQVREQTRAVYERTGGSMVQEQDTHHRSNVARVNGLASYHCDDTVSDDDSIRERTIPSQGKCTMFLVRVQVLCHVCDI